MQGYIINPTEEKWLDCYIDANFAGMWNPEDSDDLSNIQFWTGYIITYTTCLVLWVPKLQMEIILNMTEEEYIALSQALHDVIPMKALLKELEKSVH